MLFIKLLLILFVVFVAVWLSCSIWFFVQFLCVWRQDNLRHSPREPVPWIQVIVLSVIFPACWLLTGIDDMRHPEEINQNEF